MRGTSWSPGVFCFITALLLAPIANAQASAKRVPYAQNVQARIQTVLDNLQTGGEIDASIQSLQGIFDEAVLYAPEDRPDALRQAAFALRLARQMKAVPDKGRASLIKYLRANDNLAQALVFLIQPGQDIAGAYRVLDELRESRPEALDKYATLTAAICVAQHHRVERGINENNAKSAPPLDIFDYYVKNEPRMFYGIRNVPAELLLFVVDTTASIDDLTWALNKYAGDKDVGHRFFDVKYDYDNFRLGTPKKITKLGFTLPNIVQYGGVCADQAYFASEVGKAIGVPTAYTTGESGEGGHAWVGFLQSDGRSGRWNFNSGRYEAYRGVRGNVRDPRTGHEIPDAYVSLSGEMIGTRPIDRYNAGALTDAAQRLIELEKNGLDLKQITAPKESASTRPSRRNAEVANELALIEAALHQSPGYSPAWFAVRDLAVENKLSPASKDLWFQILMRLGAKRYPDFTLAMLSPMVATVPDPVDQDKVWNNALFPLFQTRFDLAASIRMQEAAMWEKNHQPDKAGRCYLDVVDRYADAGPFVIDALKGAEKLLASTNRADKVLVLYEQTWSKTKQPTEGDAEWMSQSNWYHVGKMYARKLTEAGDAAKAEAVEARLQKVLSTPPK